MRNHTKQYVGITFRLVPVLLIKVSCALTGIENNMLKLFFARLIFQVMQNFCSQSFALHSLCHSHGAHLSFYIAVEHQPACSYCVGVIIEHKRVKRVVFILVYSGFIWTVPWLAEQFITQVVIHLQLFSR